MISDDADIVDHGHALPGPYVVGETFRVGRLLMRTPEAKRRTGAGHHNGSRAVTVYRGKPEFVEFDIDRARDAINPLWKINNTIRRIDCRLNRACVVRLAITLRAIAPDVAIAVAWSRASVVQRSGSHQSKRSHGTDKLSALSELVFHCGKS